MLVCADNLARKFQFYIIFRRIRPSKIGLSIISSHPAPGTESEIWLSVYEWILVSMIRLLGVLMKRWISKSIRDSFLQLCTITWTQNMHYKSFTCSFWSLCPMFLSSFSLLVSIFHLHLWFYPALPLFLCISWSVLSHLSTRLMFVCSLSSLVRFIRSPQSFELHWNTV